MVSEKVKRKLALPSSPAGRSLTTHCGVGADDVESINVCKFGNAEGLASFLTGWKKGKKTQKKGRAVTTFQG